MVVAVTNPAQSTLQRILVRDLIVDEEELNLTPSELFQVKVLFQENSHDTALITTQLTKTQITRFVDKQVSFSFGKRYKDNTFNGYVVSITPNRGYKDDTIVDIRCLGPTWALQGGEPRFAADITVPTLFAEIVNSIDLAAQVDAHPYVFPSLANTNGSDWEFLQYLASQVGYVIYTYKGMVRLVDPSRVLTQSPIYATYFKGDDILDSTRELLDWEATTASLNLRENKKPTYGFFDNTSPTLSSSDAGKRFDITRPIRDRDMAKTYEEAWNRRVDFWNSDAKARIQGDARVSPGTNVAVKVSGVRGKRNDHDGTWLVRGVSHSMTHNSFQTLLNLARDSFAGIVNNDPSWFWNTGRGEPTLFWDSEKKRWKSRWVGVATSESSTSF